MSSLLSSYAPIGEEILEAGPLDVRAPARREAASAESVSSVSLGDVVDFTISARESFEVFMGRRYDPSELSFGVNAQVLVQDACVPSSPAFEKLAAHLTTRVGAGLPRATRLAPALASPLARYTKLLTELAALQAELADVDSEDARGGVAAGSRYSVMSLVPGGVLGCQGSSLVPAAMLSSFRILLPPSPGMKRLASA